MPKYIDADRFLDSIKKRANECRNLKAEAIDDEIKARADAGLAAFIVCALVLEHQPNANVEKVRHGKWIFVDGYVTCSECGARPFRFLNRFDFDEIDTFKGCPHCRAKMDGKEQKK